MTTAAATIRAGVIRETSEGRFEPAVASPRAMGGFG
jgi:hypothetical protein